VLIKLNRKLIIKSLSDYVQKCQKDGIDQDIKENGKFAIIRRELFNYECFYTCDLEPAIDELKEYGYDEGDVLQVFNSIHYYE